MAMRRWIPIVLGVLLVLVLGITALTGSCAYMVHKQVQVGQSASVGDYEREAAAVMTRFEGVPPLIWRAPPARPSRARRSPRDRSAAAPSPT